MHYITIYLEAPWELTEKEVAICKDLTRKGNLSNKPFLKDASTSAERAAFAKQTEGQSKALKGLQERPHLAGPSAASSRGVSSKSSEGKPKSFRAHTPPPTPPSTPNRSRQSSSGQEPQMEEGDADPRPVDRSTNTASTWSTSRLRHEEWHSTEWYPPTSNWSTDAGGYSHTSNWSTDEGWDNTNQAEARTKGKGETHNRRWGQDRPPDQRGKGSSSAAKAAAFSVPWQAEGFSIDKHEAMADYYFFGFLAFVFFVGFVCGCLLMICYFTCKPGEDDHAPRNRRAFCQGDDQSDDEPAAPGALTITTTKTGTHFHAASCCTLHKTTEKRLYTECKVCKPTKRQ
jgi:hypothetical protein